MYRLFLVQKLKQEVKELTTAQKALEIEKTTLQQVLDDLVSKVNSGDEGHKGSQVYGAVIKENCKLKVEVRSVTLDCTLYCICDLLWRNREQVAS